ncbi:hypothetical protein RJT34_13210 [Clitoria ternatea]|uniref:Uncharacterized protein n=1 Tax=Clitoria ternatea TaxID=43366 RepID=A0AAN9JQ82_CLITE
MVERLMDRKTETVESLLVRISTVTEEMKPKDLASQRKLERELVNGGVPRKEQDAIDQVESIANTKTCENDDLKVTVVTSEINPEEESYPSERKEATMLLHFIVADKKTWCIDK